MTPYKAALITGASSGIGRALALELAAPGTTLHLNGRNGARLEGTALACRAKGATVHANVLDVTDALAMQAWIAQAGPLDLVIANAGISAGTGIGEPETAAQARAIFAVNLDGALNTILPAMTLMRGEMASEIARLRDLAEENDHIKPEELIALVDRERQLAEVIENARTRLDAVRLIWKAPPN